MEIIPCTKATFLMSKWEESALTFRERIDLVVHLIICEFCRRFLKQTALIRKQALRLESAETLTDEEKNKMQQLLNPA